MDLYFARHDGQVTCDDFRAAMADANQRDLKQFERWYSQAGTPRVSVQTHYDAANFTYTLTLEQSCPATPDQAHKLPMHIPFAVGLLDANGNAVDVFTALRPVLALGDASFDLSAGRKLEIEASYNSTTFRY